MKVKLLDGVFDIRGLVAGLACSGLAFRLESASSGLGPIHWLILFTALQGLRSIFIFLSSSGDIEMIVKAVFFNYLVWMNWHLGSCVPSCLSLLFGMDLRFLLRIQLLDFCLSLYRHIIKQGYF